MDAFDMPQIEAAHGQNGELYHEFFHANRLSVSLYVLGSGATDPQSPTLKTRSTTSCLDRE